MKMYQTMNLCQLNTKNEKLLLVIEHGRMEYKVYIQMLGLSSVLINA